MKRRVRTMMGVAALAGCLSIWIGARAADSRETREVKDTLARQAARIESLDVSYTLATKTGLKPAQLRALAGYHNQVFLPQDQWREAFKGGNRYKHQLQPEAVDYLAETDAHGLIPPGDVDPKAPEAVRENQKKMKEHYDRAIATMKAQEAQGVKFPARDAKKRDLMERDVTRATNGRSLWMKRPMTAKVDEYQTWPAGFQGHWFGLSAYQSAAGIQSGDPTSKTNAGTLSIFNVAEWIKDRSYALEEKTEVIDGVTCLVLKGSASWPPRPAILGNAITDRIWLDRDHGLAIRRRELSRDGKLGERWENSDLREVAPGLWLPATVRHDRFADDAPEGWKGKPVLTEEIRVERVEVNRVADDLFDMPVPRKGDQVEDLRGVL